MLHNPAGRQQNKQLALCAQTSYMEGSFSENLFRSGIRRAFWPAPREDSPGDSAMPKGSSMSSLPRMRERAASDPAPNSEADARPRRPPLSKRLPGMSDAQLMSLQKAATRISLDAEHPKHANATTALPLIDAEIGRRTAGLVDGKTRSPAAGGPTDG